MKKNLDFILLVVTGVGLSLIPPWNSLARPLAQPLGKPSGLYVQEIQLSQGRKQRTLILHFSQPPAFVHAFVLPSPARLVIDVGGAVERSASATYTTADTLITRVRIGSHPRHTRFVLDLKTSQVPPFSVEQQAQRVTAVLNGPDEPDERDENAEHAEQFDTPQQGDTQVLFVRAPQAEARSQDVTPRTGHAPASPPPTVVTKKVAKKTRALQQSAGAGLKPAPAPPSAPIGTPDEEAPAQAMPLQTSSNVVSAAVPLKDPPISVPMPPAPAPVISSQDTQRAQPLSPTASQYLRRGYSLHTEGNLDGAIRQWRKVIHQAPTNAEAHYRIGLALQERGELTQAITAFSQAARLTPDDVTIHIHLGRTFEAEGNTQDALAAYRKALQLDPTSAHVHNRVGHLLAAEGNLAGAIQAWRQTIQLQPDYAYAYVSLGQALGKTDHKDEALAAYERAIRLDPRAPFVAEVRQRIARLQTAEL